jgi:SSS family solute:Na+ symporter/sodium/proline symporter
LQAVKDNLPAVIAQRDAIFPALIVAVVLMIVVSLFTPKPTEKQLAQLAD